MKNFDWTQFTLKIAVEAPLEEIYGAWTKPEELERWFLSDATYIDTTGKKIPKSQYTKERYMYEWQWHLYDLTETGIVNYANGTDHIQFTFAGNCITDIKLESYDKGTIVSLSQRDIPTDDDSKVNVRLGCDSGWSFYLVNLKSIYQGGLDLRNKDPNLKPMLNN